MNRRTSGVAAGLLASALILAACASGSQDVDEAGEEQPETSIEARPDTSAQVATDEPLVATDDRQVGRKEDVVTLVVDDGVDAVLPQGYGSVTATITSADGEVCEVCLWLADTPELRRNGLMGVTDLGDAVGMAFRWDEPVTSRFYMFQTPTPLSIAWFAASGEHVGQADMDPCLVDDSSTCERYGADAPYTVAIEMFEGQLDAIGIGPGATVALAEQPCA